MNISHRHECCIQHVYICKPHNTNTQAELCCFRYERFINFWVRFFETRKETILTMLTRFQCAVHLVMLRSLSVEIRKTQLHLQRPKSNSQLTPFQNPQILRTISSWFDVIHTPTPFPVWGFIMTMVIVISSAYERKTVPNDYAPELLTWIVRSPTKLNDKI